MKKNKNIRHKLVLWFLIYSLVNLAYGIDIPANTIITSDHVEMDFGDEVNIFNFAGNVHLEGEGLDGVCDKSEVIIKKNKDGSSHLSNADAIEKITAVGNVRITQEGRTIKAGHVVVFPREGKAVLTEKPEVIDSQGTVKGDKITFYKNDGKAYVEGGAEGGRPKIILPGLPNLKKEPEVKTPKIEKAESKPGSKENLLKKDQKGN